MKNATPPLEDAACDAVRLILLSVPLSAGNCEPDNLSSFDNALNFGFLDTINIRKSHAGMTYWASDEFIVPIINKLCECSGKLRSG